MRHWVAVLNGKVVHGEFGAPVEYVQNYEELIVNNDDVTTPYWWTPEVEFVDITGQPGPLVGATLNADGSFANPLRLDELPEMQNLVGDLDFINQMRKKTRSGLPLTPLERDRLLALNAKA